MKTKRLMISGIVKGSIAEEAGISAGDELMTVNGENIKDVFDYRFLTSVEDIVVAVRKADGEIWEVEIDKDEYEDIGMQFNDPMMDKEKRCANNCIFCFIDQLPKGMRKTLYFKDDDPRLSFTRGNYVTLTNTSLEDIDRIIRYRMSPVNISVHASDISVRRYMLGNRKAGDIIETIGKLTGSGITVNCQIVLCRGINDCDVMEKTVTELGEFYPGMSSISVVPVGLTGYRQGLTELQPYDRDSSRKVLEQIRILQERFLSAKGSRIVYAADEFYVMAGAGIPAESEYEGYPQLENGIGLITSLTTGFSDYLKEIRYNIGHDSITTPSEPAVVIASIATGEAAFEHIRKMSSSLEELSSGRLKVNVYPVRNDFFGGRITVTGLLTGRDILKQLAGKELGHTLYLSRTMFREGTDVFLDGFTVQDLEKGLGVEIVIVDNTGRDFAVALLKNC